MIDRKCRDCKQLKELNDTNFIKRGAGWRGNCRICHNKKIRKRNDLSDLEKARGLRWRNSYKSKKPFDYLISYSRNNSKKNNREFSIKSSDLENLWNSQQCKCFYTNIDMTLEFGLHNSISIDRIDSSKGYTIDNIVLCCRKVNTVKNDLTVKELLEFCNNIINNTKLMKL